MQNTAPISTESHWTKGNEALRRKDYDNALRHYRAAQAATPELGHLIEHSIQLAMRHLRELPWAPKAHATNTPQVSTCIDVVVPVFNALEDVQACLASLVKHTDGFDVRVIVVNDGSNDATTEWLRGYCRSREEFLLIEHPNNLGYTRAVNTGLRASTAEFVITQNSDTIVSAGWLSGMVACMSSDRKIGIVGPLSNAASWQNVPLLRDASGGFAVNELPQGMTPDEMAALVASTSQCNYPRIPFVNGFCFMIRRAVIEAIGYMDEETFPVGYGEENDYCIRAKDADFDLAIADNVFVFHAKSKSFGHEKRKELSIKGSKSLKQKHTEAKLASLVRLASDNKDLDELRTRIAKEIVRTSNPKSTGNRHEPSIDLFPEPIFSPKGYSLERKLKASQIAFDHHGNMGIERAWNSLNLRIGVQAHIFYPELTDEIAESISNIKCKFNLYVTCKSQTDRISIEEVLKARLPQASIKIKIAPNRGRDIAPLLCEFASELLKNDIICHVHSKQSPHNLNKQDWRRQLLHGLLANEEHTLAILSLLRDNKTLGMIFPEYHWSLKEQIHWGGNFQQSSQLLSRCGWNANMNSLTLFPAGSMFWARSEALKPLLQIQWKYEDFEEELGQVDGTLAHAVERCLGEIVVRNGYKLIQVSPAKPYNLKSYYTKKWPYVRQNRVSEKTNPKGIRGVVYSAVSGGYDRVLDHEIWTNGIEHRMISDSSIENQKQWSVSVLERNTESAVRFARYVKTDPYRFCHDYDFAIWIDANVLIRTDISKYFEMCIVDPQVPLFLIEHPERRCVFDEAEAVIAAGKDTPERVKQHVERYKKEGMPRNLGLIETNLMLINLRHTSNREFFNLWKKEIEIGSHRDQLSINYCLWKTGIKYRAIFKEKMSLRDSKDFAYFGHGKNSGLIED